MPGNLRIVTSVQPSRYLQLKLKNNIQILNFLNIRYSQLFRGFSSTTWVRRSLGYKEEVKVNKNGNLTFPAGTYLTLGRGGSFYSIIPNNYLILLSGWPNVCQRWWAFRSLLERSRGSSCSEKQQNSCPIFFPLPMEVLWANLPFQHFSAGGVWPLCSTRTVCHGSGKASCLLMNPFPSQEVDFRMG